MPDSDFNVTVNEPSVFSVLEQPAASVTISGAIGAVSSVFARTGAVSAISGDYSAFYQPLDADLTSLAAASAIGTWYYRSAANTWNPVTIGSGITFSGGTLSASGGGTVTSVSVSGANGIGVSGSPITTTGTIALSLGAITPTTVNGNTITTGTGTLTLGSATLNAGAGGTLGSNAFTSTAYVPATTTVNGHSLSGNVTVTPTDLGLVIGTNTQAWDTDLDALAALSGTHTIYYRSAANTWSAVTVGSGLDFTGATLSSTAAGGTVTNVTGTAPVSVATGTTTPVVSMAASTNSVDGYLTAVDHTTFNAKVGTSRAINTTAPITGGGDLSSDRTFAMAAATTSVDGYLNSTDWNTFNNKQVSGSYGLTTNPLSQFAATTSAQLAGVISDEVGTGPLVFQSYVDSAIQNFDLKDPVAVATITVLPFSPSYANGSSGVGATLTAGVGVLIIDGYTPILGDPIGAMNQASSFQNGVYTVTTLGTALVGYQLTRRSDFNQTANIVYGDSFGVLNGTTNKNQQFTMNNQNVITVGTTAITFAQTSGGSQLVAGTGITITGNTVATAAIPNSSLSNSAITIAGTSTALGGSISLDTISGVSANGFLKRTSANTWTNDASTYITGNQTITLSGDATGSGATAITVVNANLPDGVTQAGSLLLTDIAAPSSPAAAHLKVFGDSTDLRFHDKNAAGTIGTTVVADTGATNNFLTGISPAGVISKAQPAASNLSDGVTGTGPVVLGTLPRITTGINDSNGNAVLGITAATSAVNSINIANSATGATSQPTISAVGSDTDIGIWFTPKGAFNFRATNGGFIFGDPTGGAITDYVRINASDDGNIKLRSAGQYLWSNSSTNANGTIDTGLARNAAGIVESNTGTAGQWGGIKAGVRDGVTNSFSAGLTLGHQSTGTPVAGFGMGIAINLNSDTTADRNAGRIMVIWSDPADATHSAYMDFGLANAGAANASKMRLFPSGGLSVNSTTDPGAGIINANTGFKIANTSPTGTGNVMVLSASPVFTGTVGLPIVTQIGKTTTYNNIATVSNGIPSELATIDSTGLVAAVTTATLYTPAATGMYRISAALKITTTGTAPVAGPITITYTDGDGSVAQSQVMLLQSTTGTVVTTTVNNSTTTGTVNGSMVIYAKTGVAIQYAVAASGTFGTGVYSVHLKCEAL